MTFYDSSGAAYNFTTLSYDNTFNGRQLEASIIKQISDSAANRATLASAASSKELVLYLLLFTALLNVFFPGPLKALVSLARSLQLILHLQLLGISVTGVNPGRGAVA